MEAALELVHHTEVADGGNNPGVVWGVAGIMSKDILPNGPAERRERNRLYALRAMDRLGLLGEENLIPTLAARPALRWLADERGARWAILIELGRIGEPGAFEEAVKWALESRPHPEEAKDYIRRIRLGAIDRAGAGSTAAKAITEKRAMPKASQTRGKTAEDRGRRC